MCNAGKGTGTHLREVLARYHWLGGRIADYQSDPTRAVAELKACLLLCQGQPVAGADGLLREEGNTSLSAATSEVRVMLGGCHIDAEVSSRAAAAKLDALRVYSACAQGSERIAVRHPPLCSVLSPKLSPSTMCNFSYTLTSFFLLSSTRTLNPM